MPLTSLRGLTDIIQFPNQVRLYVYIADSVSPFNLDTTSPLRLTTTTKYLKMIGKLVVFVDTLKD
jgi:hypothetical protein